MLNKLNRRQFPILWIAVALLWQACEKSPVYYYASAAGDDNNPGSMELPFRTIDRINKQSLSGGDGFFFKGGEKFDGTLSLSILGSPESPVIISSYGDGTAILNGGEKEAVVIKGNYLKLSNIHAQGNGRKEGNTTNGIRLIEVSNAVVENCLTDGFQKSGLELYNCTHVDVKKVRALDNGFCGIYVTGDWGQRKSKNILIQDSRAENNAGDPTNLTNHSGNGILIGLSDSVMVDHCTATNNGWDMPRIGNGPVGIWAYECSNMVIQYCVSYRNRTAKGAKDGGGFDFDGGITNSIIQYCLSYENEGAGYGLFQFSGATPWHHNIVRYCVSMNDALSTEGAGGIFVWNGTTEDTQLADCLVHNNVIYSMHASTVEFEPASLNKNFLFYDNIFVGTGEVIYGPSSGERFEGNAWWSSGGETRFRGYMTVGEWSAAAGQETIAGKLVGRQVDPLMNGPFAVTITDPYQLQTLANFSLRAESPLIDVGRTHAEHFNLGEATVDFYGTKLPQGNAIEPGIYELPDK